MLRYHRGITLTEVLVVMAVIGLISAAVTTLSMQSMKIYARTSEHIEPEASLELAFKRMGSIVREAMFIRIGSSATAMEVALPLKGNDGKIATNSVLIDTTRGMHALVRAEGMHICFFLGRRSATNPTIAVPDPINGNILFMITTGSKTTTGTDIINDSGSLESSYSNAQAIITGISSSPSVPDPQNPGNALPTTIFAYTTVGSDTSAFHKGLNAQLLRITLTVPIPRGPSGGEAIRDHTLSTQFCLRNFETL